MAEKLKSSEASSPIGGDILRALTDVTARLIELADVFDSERILCGGDNEGATNISTNVNIAMALFRLRNAAVGLTEGVEIADSAAFKILTDQKIPRKLREAIASIIDAGKEIRDEIEDSLYIPPVVEAATTDTPASVDPQYSPTQGQILSPYQLNT